MKDSLVVVKDWGGEGRGRWVWLQKSNGGILVVLELFRAFFFF